MPAYNEGPCIYDNITTTIKVMEDAALSGEIVVVDDGSSDNTREEIERAAVDFVNVTAVRNPYNMGKGMALRTGYDHSNGEVIVFLDADLDLHPSQITDLVAELEQGPYDVVVTSKHHPQSRLSYPLSRRITSYVYYMIIKALFRLPVRDTQTGLKIFRRRVLDEVFHRLLVKTYAYDVELLATAVRFGFTVHELPVVMEFKREMKWGRIRLNDVLKIFADTLAIFYRLRLLCYYDVERPPFPRDRKPVLVIVKSAPPSPDIIGRLNIDADTHIACLSAREHRSSTQDTPSSATGETSAETITFADTGEVARWLSESGKNIEIIGFLGPGCTPLGTWVKNALRNFGDNRVAAVCGPVVSGPFGTFREKIASMLYSTSLTTGPNSYLFGIRRVKTTARGLRDNVFMRASLFITATSGEEREKFVTESDFIYHENSELSIMRYDPDVAVSKPAPPLFLAYLDNVARRAFSEGRAFLDRRPLNNRLWSVTPLLILAMLLFGGRILPWEAYCFLAGLYLVVILLTGMLYFDPAALPVFMVGVLFDHGIRAVAVPLGFLVRLFAGNRNRARADG